jgi:hypothetical protein
LLKLFRGKSETGYILFYQDSSLKEVVVPETPEPTQEIIKE